MTPPRALLAEWEARLRAEGLGRIEEHRKTVGSKISRRWRQDKASYWDLASQFAATLEASAPWLLLSRGAALAGRWLGDIRQIDARVWRLHVAGMPRWKIAVALGLPADDEGRAVRTSIERCRRQMRRWRRIEEQASAAELVGYGAAAELALVMAEDMGRGRR